MSVVYWIHNENQKDFTLEGYIGVTSLKNPIERFNQHKSYAGTNIFLKEAFKSANLLKFDIILESDKDICYLYEYELRPKSYIGWNTAPGGRNPHGRYNTEYQRKIASKQELVKFANGSHYFLSDKIRKATKERNKKLNVVKYTCNYCDLSGKGPGMLRYHFDNCKYKYEKKTKKCEEIRTCDRCGKSGGWPAMNRWHFNNCKKKVC